MQLAFDYIVKHCKDDKLRELMIVRRGVCIHAGDNTSNGHNIWSCSKSFTSTVLGLLIEDGKCRLDTKVGSVLPELKKHYPTATLRHFTTMTSGFSAKGRSRWEDENEDWSWTPYDPAPPYFPPGTAYAYWDEAQMTLGRALTRIGGRELREYLQQRVFDPIGMGKVKWLHEGEIDGIPINNGCTNVHVNAQQLARFGHLFLNRGTWGGKQIVPAKWIDQATRTQVPADLPVGDTDRANVLGPGAYGYNWWTNGGKNAMPDAPPRTYYASGLNHNLLFVVPEWDMVVVRMGVDGNPPIGKPQAWNGFFKLMSEALIQP
ncbi:MAG: serine hydrolase [Aureliella sp.]